MSESIQSTLKVIGSIIALISVVFGTYFFIDTTYAKAEQVKEVYAMVQEDRLNYRIEKLQERIWKIEDRHQKIEDMDSDTKDEYRKLNKEKEDLQKKLDNIYKEESK